MSESIINLCYFVVIGLVIAIVFFLLLHPSNCTSSTGTSLASIAGAVLSP
ncbi:MAG: hypothetical protein PVI20_16880 [Desulfobacteraceae bacterium]|jgi:hypothetical protein